MLKTGMKQIIAASASLTLLSACQAPLTTRLTPNHAPTEPTTGAQAVNQTGLQVKQLQAARRTTSVNRSFFFKSTPGTFSKLNLDSLAAKATSASQYRTLDLTCGYETVPPTLDVADSFPFPQAFENKEVALTLFNFGGEPWQSDAVVWSPTEIIYAPESKYTGESDDNLRPFIRLVKFPDGDVLLEFLGQASGCWNTLTSLDLKTTYQVISPNGDGVQDNTDILVTAGTSSNWELTLDQHDEFKISGSGNKSISWSEFLNNGMLSDGKYSLRLTSGTEVKTAEVVIDTTAPTVTGLTLKAFESDRTFKYTATVLDPIQSNSHSNINQSSFKVTLNGLNVNAQNAHFTPETGAFELILSEGEQINLLKMVDPATDSHKPVTLKVEDAAGNSAIGEYYEKSLLAGEMVFAKNSTFSLASTSKPAKGSEIIRPLLGVGFEYDALLPSDYLEDLGHSFYYEIVHLESGTTGDSGLQFLPFGVKINNKRQPYMPIKWNCRQGTTKPQKHFPARAGNYECVVRTTVGWTYPPVEFTINNDVDIDSLGSISENRPMKASIIWGPDPDAAFKDWTGIIPGWNIPLPKGDTKLVLGSELYRDYIQRRAETLSKDYNFVVKESGVADKYIDVAYRGYFNGKPIVVETQRTLNHKTNRILETVQTVYPSKLQ